MIVSSAQIRANKKWRNKKSRKHLSYHNTQNKGSITIVRTCHENGGRKMTKKYYSMLRNRQKKERKTTDVMEKRYTGRCKEEMMKTRWTKMKCGKQQSSWDPYYMIRLMIRSMLGVSLRQSIRIQQIGRRISVIDVIKRIAELRWSWIHVTW